jgi:RNA polymerase sigma-70 factor, ECF subfamily
VKFAYIQVRNLELANDIVQEAFARIWASPRTPRPAPEFKRWLYRAISNLVKDHHRRERRRTEADARNLAAAPVDEVERWLSGQVIMAAVQRLSLRDRQLIYLRYFEDQPLSECARLLGLHEVSVRVLIGRTLERLRRQFAALDPQPEVAANVP